MEQQLAASADPKRIVAIDALRGFALLGIVLVHMVEQYLGGPPPEPNFGVFAPVDSAVGGVLDLLVRGKFFMMFSLLFGLSFFMLMERGAGRDTSFRSRFLWRLTLLLLIGLVHHLFYRGDILTIYALLGAVLLLFYRASDRTLLLTALLLFLGAPRVLLLAAGEAFGFNPMLLPNNPTGNLAYFEVLRSGSILAVFASNLLEGLQLKLGFQFGLFGRGYQTLALFLIGLYLGRQRWHESLPERRPALRRVLAWGGTLSLAAAGAGALLMPMLSAGPSGGTQPPLWGMAVGLGFQDLFNAATAAVLMAGFVLLYLRPAGGRILAIMAPVGQTALTSYVLQTLLGTYILYGWGMGRIGVIGASTAALLALCIFGAQIVASTLWLQHFRFGPIEWVWRTLTLGRLQPMRARPRGALPVTKGAAPA